MKSVLLLGHDHARPQVFPPEVLAALPASLHWIGPPANAATFRERLREFSDVEVIFGTWGMPLLDAEALEALPGDIHADKQRFSAFIPKYSDLPQKLEARGIRNVAIAGMLTNFCCETSARDAMMLDYHVAMISDANAARFEDDHNVGFQTVYQSFGDVVTINEMLGEILKPAAQPT